MPNLRDAWFDTKIERAFIKWSRGFFSIQELESSFVLKLVFGATIVSHLVTFSSWSASVATTRDAFERGSYLCWPYLQNCGDWLLLRTLPEGYSQPVLYMVFYGLMLFAAYAIYRTDWVIAHMALMPLFVWHTLVTFFLAQSLVGNYEYYLFIFSFILLCIPHKEYFLKLAVVLFYFLATSAKIHEAWIVGTYFSSLKTGLPLIPFELIPVATAIVMFMEMVGAWFLLSRHWVPQRVVIGFFIFFHLYSGIIVGFRYPTIVLPTLFILFGPLYRYTPAPHNIKSVVGWILVCLMLTAQSLPKWIPGDEKLTLEGNMYGLYMFESNHQCISTMRIVAKDGKVSESRDESISARDRCDPYRYWFRIKVLCDRLPDISRIEWTFDHSINGNPFLRIVDVQNACALDYKPLSHNPWIKTEKDNPTIIGFPVQNIYI